MCAIAPPREKKCARLFAPLLFRGWARRKEKDEEESKRIQHPFKLPRFRWKVWDLLRYSLSFRIMDFPLCARFFSLKTRFTLECPERNYMETLFRATFSPSVPPLPRHQSSSKSRKIGFTRMAPSIGSNRIEQLDSRGLECVINSWRFKHPPNNFA